MKTRIVGWLRTYCGWIDAQAKGRFDFLVLGLGPLLLLAGVLSLLPEWLGELLAWLLALPAMYVAFAVVQAYARRGRQ